MKISSSQTQSSGSGPAQGASQAPPAQRTENREEGKSKSFDTALGKKASQKEEAEKRGASASGLEAGAPPLPAFLAQPSFAAPVETTQTASVGAVLPPELAALSGEIQHAIEVSPSGSVRIQFEASVLDGLAVTINREGGMLHVSLQTGTPEMARFLEVHAASLAQTLERPERPAFISIETRPHQSDSHGGGRQGSGQQQEDREDTVPQGDDL